MNTTPEIVKNLLDKLITPKYEDVIDDYKIKIEKNFHGKFLIYIDVIFYDKVKFMDMNQYYTLENKVYEDVKSILRYFSPHFSSIEFFIYD